MLFIILPVWSYFHCPQFRLQTDPQAQIMTTLRNEHTDCRIILLDHFTSLFTVKTKYQFSVFIDTLFYDQQSSLKQYG